MLKEIAQAPWNNTSTDSRYVDNTLKSISRLILQNKQKN